MLGLGRFLKATENIGPDFGLETCHNVKILVKTTGPMFFIQFRLYNSSTFYIFMSPEAVPC